MIESSFLRTNREVKTMKLVARAATAIGAAAISLAAATFIGLALFDMLN